jgi:hypothetical protein
MDEDPAFARCQCTGFFHRLSHAARGPISARKPDGRTVFSCRGGWSNAGKASTNIWVPRAIKAWRTSPGTSARFRRERRHGHPARVRVPSTLLIGAHPCARDLVRTRAIPFVPRVPFGPGPRPDHRRRRRRPVRYLDVFGRRGRRVCAALDRAVFVSVNGSGPVDVRAWGWSQAEASQASSAGAIRPGTVECLRASGAGEHRNIAADLGGMAEATRLVTGVRLRSRYQSRGSAYLAPLMYRGIGRLPARSMARSCSWHC